MRRSKVLEKLRADEPVMVCSPTPYASSKLTEMMGQIGVDCVWIDMEHQDYGWQDAFNLALGARAADMDAMIRIRKGAYWAFSRAYEAGANGVMLPHCMSAAEAAEAVKWSKFCPQGLRGMDGVEAVADYGAHPMLEYMEHANKESFVVVQIEDRQAVECIDEIASVEGIDVLFVGPADLTQSYDIPAQFDAPQIQQAVDRVAQAAADHGKWWGMPAGDTDAITRILKRGGRFISFGGAIIILRQGFEQRRAEFDETVQGWRDST